MVESPEFARVVQWSEVIDGAADAIVIVGPDRRIRYANQAVANVLGHDATALVGERYDVLVPEADREVHEDHHRRYVEAPTARRMGTRVPLRARRADGTDVDVDIALVPLGGDEPMVAAFIRDISHVTALVDRISATSTMFRSALAGADRAELERIAVSLARRVIGAETCWLGRANNGGIRIDIVAGGDSAVWSERRILLDSTPTSEPAILSADAVAEATGSVLMIGVGTDIGAAVLGAHRPSEVMAVEHTFGRNDLEAAQSFAETCSIVFELVELRERMAELATIADHDRIARDLHDSAIQRLFVATMRLESVLPAASAPAGERIAETVEELDGVMRDIRAAIFDLRRPAFDQRGLRAVVAEEVDRFVDTLGFAPSLRFEGPVDEAIPEAVGAAVPLVVREALSNVARHARARRARVTVEIDGDDAVVTVSDDGTGLPSMLPSGGGIDNLVARARSFGGDCRVSDGELGGVTVRWHVPRSPPRRPPARPTSR